LLCVGPVLGPEAFASVESSAQPGKEDYCFAKSLARDRPCIQAFSSYATPFLHDGRSLAQLRGLHRGPLAGRATPDTQQIEVVLFGYVFRFDNVDLSATYLHYNGHFNQYSFNDK
jgi:hypothetical protein